MILLDVKDLSRDFGGLKALNSVNFQLHQNQILGIIGPNGAGKTTCFNLISGFYKPTSGQVLFKGEDITNIPPYILAEKGIVRTFQTTSLFGNLTVFENVLIGAHKLCNKKLIEHITKPVHYRAQEERVKEKCFDILNFVSLGDYKDELAQSLAYGYQRKLEIAIALSAEPELILLDEPAAGMNPSESIELMKLIKEIRNKGLTVLLVEHDMKLVMAICDRLVVLDHGSKIAEGEPQEIRKNKEVIDVYLGSFAHAGESSPAFKGNENA